MSRRQKGGKGARSKSAPGPQDCPLPGVQNSSLKHELERHRDVIPRFLGGGGATGGRKPVGLMKRLLPAPRNDADVGGSGGMTGFAALPSPPIWTRRRQGGAFRYDNIHASCAQRAKAVREERPVNNGCAYQCADLNKVFILDFHLLDTQVRLCTLSHRNSSRQFIQLCLLHTYVWYRYMKHKQFTKSPPMSSRE